MVMTVMIWNFGLKRQTLFPKKKGGVVERSKLRILRNMAVSYDPCRPQPVAPKPRIQTSSLASPASSLRSGVSGNESHHSAKSASSEVSVVSDIQHIYGR